LGQQFQIALFSEPMTAPFPVDEIDVVGGQKFHQLHASFERDDVIFHSVQDPEIESSR
jgi:hypothetical protein